ncbi:uncharacterized protein LOC129322521 [Prosopis cineraria]|uniref:uncharacterized protein LOC129322521 n=1 Tax=Prosopis cineraria TaxID=364024 RepID=UPI0024102BFB|nr:uncharacterized protein LOC129322521 [Prosopis cineraria]
MAKTKGNPLRKKSCSGLSKFKEAYRGKYTTQGNDLKKLNAEAITAWKKLTSEEQDHYKRLAKEENAGIKAYEEVAEYKAWEKKDGHKKLLEDAYFFLWYVDKRRGEEVVEQHDGEEEEEEELEHDDKEETGDENEEEGEFGEDEKEEEEGQFCYVVEPKTAIMYVLDSMLPSSKESKKKKKNIKRAKEAMLPKEKEKMKSRFVEILIKLKPELVDDNYDLELKVVPMEQQPTTSNCGMYVIFCLRQWNNTAREEWDSLTMPPLTMEQLSEMRGEVREFPTEVFGTQSVARLTKKESS